MAKKKIKIIKVEGTPEWMISFGDLMSCLLVFFILLLTFSSSTPGKIMDLIANYSEGYNAESDEIQEGDIPGGGGKTDKIEVPPEDEAPIKLANLLIAQKYSEYQNVLYELGFKNKITIKRIDDGLLFELKTSDIFSSNNTMKPNSGNFLQSIANAAFSLKKEFRIISAPVVKEDSTISSLAWNAEQQVLILKSLFVTKYKIPSSFIVSGMIFQKTAEGTTRFLIAEKTEKRIENIENILDVKKKQETD